jgi:hypothetical protein
MKFINIFEFGTLLYGSRDKNSIDNSFITTAWFTLFYLPIIPLDSYRVIVGRQKGYGVGASVTYKQMQKIPLNRKQVINTYLLWYLTAVIIIGIPVIFFWWYGNTPIDQLPASLRPQY